jgi:uncharacterized protein (DUF427 family)
MGNRAVTPRTGRATASVDGTVLASTTAWVETEGNVYFPPASVRREFFSGTDHSTYCPWKGNASYYDIEVNGSKLDNAAWYYPETYDGANDLKDHVAFCKRSPLAVRMSVC